LGRPEERRGLSWTGCHGGWVFSENRVGQHWKVLDTDDVTDALHNPTLQIRKLRHKKLSNPEAGQPL
jgi:hypothetical protein